MQGRSTKKKRLIYQGNRDLSLGKTYVLNEYKVKIELDYLQELVELVNILWACKIIVVEVMNDWSNSRQKNELGTPRTTLAGMP